MQISSMWSLWSNMSSLNRFIYNCLYMYTITYSQVCNQKYFRWWVGWFITLIAFFKPCSFKLISKTYVYPSFLALKLGGRVYPPPKHHVHILWIQNPQESQGTKINEIPCLVLLYNTKIWFLQTFGIKKSWSRNWKHYSTSYIYM